MDEKSDRFDVLSSEEMRKKYYSPDELPPAIKLDVTKVPISLRSLIPLAEKWGISDDILREDFVSRASAEELKVLRETVDTHRSIMNEWLAGPEADNQPFS